MPLRADTRRVIEHALRAGLALVLAFALWRSVTSASGGDRAVAMSASAFDRGVDHVTSTGVTRAIDLDVDASLSSPQRDLLVALRRAGVTVTWHGDVPAIAIEVTREREPFADGRITVVNEARTPLALADSAGPLDTIRSKVATLQVGTLVGAVRGGSGTYVARGMVPAPTDRRAVLILGRVGWEVKFVAAALAEAGWAVRSSSPAAPTVVVHDDNILPIDTARYDAIVALDSTASAFGGAISKFVSDGGGLVALGAAFDVQAIRDVAPASAGDRLPGKILLAEDTVTTRDLPSRALVNMRTDGVPLVKEPQGLVLAARRVGIGRVLAIGYEDTWRWRMLGGESGLALHRDWWSHAVGAVAPAREAMRISANRDAAPRPAMIDAFGAPSTNKVVSGAPPSNPLPLYLLAMIAIALLVETGSRRFRGLR